MLQLTLLSFLEYSFSYYFEYFNELYASDSLGSIICGERDYK